MAINDYVMPVYNSKHDYWILLRGRETFYDDNRYLITFETEAEAIEWAKARGLKIHPMPDEAVKKIREIENKKSFYWFGDEITK